MDINLKTKNNPDQKNSEEQALVEAIDQQFAHVERRWGLSAFKQGWSDAQENKPCPYPDYRTDGGQVTFSRAYRRMWAKGLQAYRNFKERNGE